MSVKIKCVLLFLLFLVTVNGYSQIGSDGSYLWNSTGISYTINDKYELTFGNKDHYSTQINHLDYLHFEIIGYRKITGNFSLGLGARQSESYKSNSWNSGQTYMVYSVLLFNPINIKIKFANRLTAKVSKSTDTQYGLDNISNIDFFTKATWKFPKPYLQDEIFSNFNSKRVQTIRIYCGLHLIKRPHWGFDIYYCYLQSRSTAEWKYYNVLGMGTKFKI